ncbi:hypothetical protein NDU88_012316 [Pleurodeles waltl]|uniref:Uncharacterized protein n=1 Tax=Pleurodeles waltl TaxID=8319 RepID=A0AAV7R1L0_PLEWA|nr:hypothetical protein NDU88_012316 [Pleurodeles waltl]
MNPSVAHADQSAIALLSVWQVSHVHKSSRGPQTDINSNRALQICCGPETAFTNQAFTTQLPLSGMLLSHMRIVPEIAAMSRHLEAMDSKITDLSTDFKSIQADISGFQDKVTGLDHA